MKKLLLILLLMTGITSADYLGSWAIDDALTIMTTTHRFSSGAAYAATGDVDLWIYEDGTAAQIQDLVMAGFDSVTGLYSEQVTLSAANGFEAGKSYNVLIQATVDGVSAIQTHSFQILASVNTEEIENSALPCSVATLFSDALTAANIETECDSAITANTLILDLPTTAEFEARTIATAAYFDPAADDVNLASTGLDNIAATEVDGVANTFREMIVQMWQRFFLKATATGTAITTYKADGTTVNTTQTVSNDGTTQTVGEATL